jgi:uncharacterized protein YecE (DUF72 family)
MTGTIRVGIGGWTFPPWRGIFYPEGLAQKRELEYASRHLTSIEINGTYYGSQKPESFARWREETPEGFVFALKGPRFTTNRRILAEAEPSIERFFASGVLNLQEKLGPINWQLLPTKRFDPADFEAFLKLLPKTIEGRKILHVVEVRPKDFEPRSSSICCVPTKPAWSSRTKTRFRIFSMSRRRSFTFACRGHRKGRSAATLRRRLIYGRRVRSLGPGATSQITSNR